MEKCLNSSTSPARADLLVENNWATLRKCTEDMLPDNPLLKAIGKTVIMDSPDMATGLCRALSRQNIDSFVKSEDLSDLFISVYRQSPELVAAAAIDLMATVKRDPAAVNILYPFLHFKGFHALQTYRIAHWLWEKGHKDTAVFLQNRSSVLYHVDIHPAAKVGKGIVLDHAHGIVIGETAVVEDNVYMLQNATLGRKGMERGNRHPKIRQGVIIGAGAIILGNVEIGKCTIIAAGSVVLDDIPPYTLVAGNPAKIKCKLNNNTSLTSYNDLVNENCFPE